MKSSISWSLEQEAIFSWFNSGEGHLVIQARAGTGKTTTIKEAFNHAPETRMLYAVFNKRNQKEADAKIRDPRVEVKTLHSLGFSYIKANWSGVKPDDQVEIDRVAAVLGNKPKESLAKVLKLVGFAKNTLIAPTQYEVEKICEEQDIDFSQENFDGVAAAILVLAKSMEKDEQGRISFNDMVWLPVRMNWVTPRFGLVVVDEAQDMNLPQLTMARQASKGRVAVVGDDRQAIYGFRGAVSDGMAMMKRTLDAATLGLTTTYRCPKSVVTLAQAIVGDYNAAPSAPEGVVKRVSATVAVLGVEVGDSILSRLNAPLMPIALQVLRQNKPARIEGRDIGKQLIGMVKSMRASSVVEFIGKVTVWETKTCVRLAQGKNAEAKIEQTHDIAETLRSLAEDLDEVSEIEERINKLFQDTDGDSAKVVTLSSVHKAKGLEWPRVFVLSETFNRQRKGKAAPSLSAQKEEANIYYVAITRSMRELYLVGDGGTDKIEPSLVPLAAAITPNALVAPARPVVSATLKAPPRPARREPVAPFVPTIQPPPKDWRDDWSLPVGYKYRAVGEILARDGSDYVCIQINQSRARFQNMSRRIRSFEKNDGTIKEFESSSGKFLDVSPTRDERDVIKKLNSDELNNFLTGGKVAAVNESKTNNETESESMKKTTTIKKTATSPKAKTSKPTLLKGQVAGMTGSAAYMRELHASGLTKTQAIEKLVARYPIFGKGTLATDPTSRWDMAERIAKTAKATTKAPAKVGKAPAKPVAKATLATKAKAPAPKRPAAKKPAAPARPETAVAAPPRPVATAPVEGEGTGSEE